jgi:hypothetical protein
LDEILYREEMMWQQQSQISWLKGGDRKTRFFHMQAKWRSRKNKIKKLKRADGSWCDAPNKLKSMAWDFFVDLFTADPEVCPRRVLCHVEPKINQVMNEDLCKEFSEKEISDAMFLMGVVEGSWSQ